MAPTPSSVAGFTKPMKERNEHATVVSHAKKFHHAAAGSVALTAMQSSPIGIRAMANLCKRQVGTMTLGWSKLG